MATIHPICHGYDNCRHSVIEGHTLLKHSIIVVWLKLRPPQHTHTQGGNDYEIYEDPRTLGHKVTSPEDTMSQLKELFF